MRIRAEIEGTVSNDFPRQKEGRILVFDSEFQRDICFVVLEVDIILRGVLLDEIVLQEKGLFFAAGEDKINMIDVSDKLLCLYIFFPFPDIAPDPVFEVLCLPDIDDIVVAVPEPVNAGRFGKIVDMLFGDHRVSSICSIFRRRSLSSFAFSKSHFFAASAISFFNLFTIFERCFGLRCYSHPIRQWVLHNNLFHKWTRARR